ncbi:MAG TPA: transcriptional repressor NrdR [Firmicutes bacterium]|nr:transcriptional repressor NrdR [Bacillota bacterium]
MKCPYCGVIDSRVIDSRPTEESTAIRRRRECTGCGRRFTTYEKIEELPLMVIKKDGSRETFERNKLLTGLFKACEKRPVSAATLEQAVDAIELALRNQLRPEVSSQEIGEMVMDQLSNIDEVAYVRFASVYRQFTDINRFRQELDKLLERPQ